MNKLSAEHAIKKQIIEDANHWIGEPIELPPLDNEAIIDEIFYSTGEYANSPIHSIQDAKYDFRDSYDHETPNIECDWSRHYESKSVAKQLDNGDWVGYTYWYGGGKHGQPESIDWIEYAYYLNCEEKEVTEIKRTFTPIKND